MRSITELTTDHATAHAKRIVSDANAVDVVAGLIARGFAVTARRLPGGHVLMNAIDGDKKYIGLSGSEAGAARELAEHVNGKTNRRS